MDIDLPYEYEVPVSKIIQPARIEASRHISHRRCKLRMAPALIKGIFPKGAFTYNAVTYTFTARSVKASKDVEFLRSVNTMNILLQRAHVTVANLNRNVRRPNPGEHLSTMSNKMI